MMLSHRCSKLGLLCILLLAAARSQLVLDDVVEPDDVQDPQAKYQEAMNPLTRMLQWGVDHTDKNELAEKAKAIREGRAQPQKIDREVMEAMFGTKISMLQESIKNLNNALEDNEEDVLVEALEGLEYHCSDIDNANDLEAVGGLDTVIRLMSHSSTPVRTAALWVIGTMAQSNPVGQDVLRSRKVLPAILAPLKEVLKVGTAQDADPKLLAKALYATSTFVRGCSLCLEDFHSEQGGNMISDVLQTVNKSTESSQWLSVKRKLVALIGDLISEEGAPEVVQALMQRFASSSSTHSSVIRDIASFLQTEDRELHEKSIDTLSILVKGAPGMLEAVIAARVPEGVKNSVSKAKAKMANVAEGDESWEDVSLLGANLLAFLLNSTDNASL